MKKEEKLFKKRNSERIGELIGSMVVQIVDNFVVRSVYEVKKEAHTNNMKKT